MIKSVRYCQDSNLRPDRCVTTTDKDDVERGCGRRTWGAVEEATAPLAPRQTRELGVLRLEVGLVVLLAAGGGVGAGLHGQLTGHLPALVCTTYVHTERLQRWAELWNRKRMNLIYTGRFIAGQDAERAGVSPSLHKYRKGH